MKTRAIILIGAIAIFALTGCTLIPPAPEGLAEAMKSQGCGLAAVETSDNFAWRFLGFSSSRSTKVACR